MPLSVGSVNWCFLCYHTGSAFLSIVKVKWIFVFFAIQTGDSISLHAKLEILTLPFIRCIWQYSISGWTSHLFSSFFFFSFADLYLRSLIIYHSTSLR